MQFEHQRSMLETPEESLQWCLVTALAAHQRTTDDVISRHPNRNDYLGQQEGLCALMENKQSNNREAALIAIPFPQSLSLPIGPGTVTWHSSTLLVNTTATIGLETDWRL